MITISSHGEFQSKQEYLHVYENFVFQYHFKDFPDGKIVFIKGVMTARGKETIDTYRPLPAPCSNQ